jgi:hypothetical protein
VVVNTIFGLEARLVLVDCDGREFEVARGLKLDSDHARVEVDLDAVLKAREAHALAGGCV